ncbi:amino acid adenylation domain-containing protein [Chitinophaga oryzae]|uniref:Amino acid adenylation domain-containing protein n=1 Tax=Chitinophaga oryzae TaxID=2725414 RepID=A0AAE7D6X0_9BACT|nr:non-ribosomal peptide synthetase [Chitinophaga oryzae]QJB31621.1 amino acid adenylation domain-containing protein [Chitinophaga oryzae]
MPHLYALTLPQQDVYYDQLLHKGSAIYNIGAKVAVNGPLDPEIFAAAAALLVAQHDSLRAVIVNNEGTPFMQIMETAVPAVVYRDFSAETDPLASAETFIRQQFALPFDLENGQLLNNYMLLKTGDRHFYIIGKYHHLIADGWSTALLFSRLGRHYSTVRTMTPPDMSAFSYLDFAEDDRTYLDSVSYQEDWHYWHSKLSLLEPPRPMQPVRERSRFTLASDRAELYLERALYDRINQFCKAQGVSVFHFLIGVVYVCFSPLIEGSTVMMGLPLLNRKNKKFKETVGLFAGVTPLFFNGFTDRPFHVLLKDIYNELRASFRHQRLPLSRMITDAGWRTGTDHRPHHQVFFSYEKHDYAVSFDGHPATVLPLTHQLERACLAVYVREFDNIRDVKVDFDYNTTYFDTALIQTCLERFQSLIPELVDNPEQPIATISLLDDASRDRILHRFNDTAVAYPSGRTVMDYFMDQCVRTPQQPAVISGDTVLNYGELERHSRALSMRLQKAAGGVAGIMLDRSWKMLSGILGILRAGVAYVPIDPEHPEPRIKYILEQSGVREVVTTARYAPWLLEQGFVPLLVDDHSTDTETAAFTAHYDAGGLAYVMYTSGSTGQPKGVEVPHSAVINFLLSMQSRLNIREGMRLLAVTTYAFDISVLELLLPLISGGTVIIASREQVQDAIGLSALLTESQPDLMQCTPGLWQLLLDAGWRGNRTMTALCGGERMPVEVARRLLQECAACWNMYGPTETTIWSCMQQITVPDDALSIGRPICNTEIYILNDRLQPLPEGVAGDIYIGGAGLARGYRGQEAMTAARFIAHPFRSSGRIYRTGDVGRWDHNGRILFGGRSDDQVKVRGYRVEPGEIEHALQQHTAVKQAAVVAGQGPDGNTFLTAYVVLQDTVSVAELQAYAKEVLPSYMVPGYIAVLEQLPMSANGKVDRKQLPAVQGVAGSSGYVAPSSALERLLVRIWEEVLVQERIGVQDNFFELGGHSLRAMQILSRIHRELGVSPGLQDLFDHPVISELAGIVAALSPSVATGTVPLAAPRPYYELSHAQRRLWILSQFPEGAVAYNICGAYRMSGPLDRDAFRQSLQAVVARHESLRTVFKTVDGMPVQQILDIAACGFHLEETDLRAAAETVSSVVALEQTTAFDLSQGPLIRARLLRTGASEYVFVLTLHHIITDGWSMEVIVGEVLRLYEAYSNGEEAVLPPLRLQYKDYACWQQEQLQQESMAAHRAYWLSQLDGHISPLDLPMAKKRPERQTFRGSLMTVGLDSVLTDKIRATSSGQQGTVFMTLLTAFKVLLHHYTTATDIVTGTPVSGRGHISLYDQVGCYMNMIPVRARFTGDDSFNAILEQVRTVALDGYTHQSYPFDKLVEELQLPRDRSRSPLFDIVVGMDTDAFGQPLQPKMRALDIQPVGDYHGISKYDLTCMFRDAGSYITMQVEYNTSLFDADSVTRLVEQYRLLLERLVDNPEQPIATISLLDDASRDRILHRFNDTAVAYPSGRTVMDYFMDQCVRTPQQPAVISGDTVLNYGELERHSRALSMRLQKAAGGVAGIMLDRSWKMLSGILGILRAGVAYVPIDPEHPEPRIKYILEQSGVREVVTTARYAPWLLEQGFVPLLVDDHSTDTEMAAFTAHYDAGGLAYVMYTSGSTGQPKGVEVPHSAVINFLLSMQSRLNIREGMRLLAVTTYAFDISVLELLLPLISGGTVIIASREQVQDAIGLSALLTESQPDLMQCTPGLWQLLLDAGWRGNRTMTALCGGERMPVEVARRLLQECAACWNMYGPTETTIWSCMQQITVPDDALSIGRPICNTEIYILNDRLQPLPEGVAGDIYIGGAGLARGYRGQEAMTAARFIAHPFRSSGRIYRTGDVGRWDHNGRILFGGRSDDQVKVRGYRVEPGEIEHALQQHTAVKQAAVVAGQGSDGNTFLTAYVVLQDTVSVAELQAYAKEVLPSYMVPGYIAVLEQLPMSANGKVDRKQLPAVQGVAGSSGYVAPASALERLLVRIWEEVLVQERIGVQDNFFELGGHSLRAMQILSRIHRELGVSPGLQDLFDHPVISELAGIVEALSPSVATGTVPLAAPRPYYELSHAQRRLWILSQFPEGAVAYNICGAYRMSGPLDRDAFRQSLQAVVARHESLRTVFKTVDGMPVQQILDIAACGFHLEETDLRAAAETVSSVVALEQTTAFDLSQGPLIRARLLRTGASEYVFVLTLHHIITDGWSMEVIVGEVLRLYEAYSNGEEAVLPPLRLQYKDYACWQQEQLQQESMAAHRAYWLSQLGGGIPRLNLPTDFARPAVFMPGAGIVSDSIPPDVYARMQALAGSWGVSLYNLLMAAAKVLLFRYTGDQDIVVGYPVSLRSHAELEMQVGFYLNTLALRTRLEQHYTYRNVVMAVRQSMLEASKHQEYPFDKVVSELRYTRDAGRAPLFDVVVVLQNLQVHRQEATRMGEMDVTVLPFDNTTSSVDLRMEFIEREDRFTVNFEYNLALFRRHTIRLLMDRFLSILTQLAGSPDIPVASVGTGEDATTTVEDLKNHFSINF